MSSIIDTPSALIKSLNNLLLAQSCSNEVSYFDYHGVQSLEQALSAAVVYLIQSAAQRSPITAGSVLPHLNLISGLIRAIVDSFYLFAVDATLIEHVYGFVRGTTRSVLSRPETVRLRPLTVRARLIACGVAVVTHVIVPYLTSRAERIAARIAPAAMPLGGGEPTTTMRSESATVIPTTHSDGSVNSAMDLVRGIASLQSLAKLWLRVVTVTRVCILLGSLGHIARRIQSPVATHIAVSQALRRVSATDVDTARPFSTRVASVTRYGLLALLVLYRAADWFIRRRSLVAPSGAPRAPPSAVVTTTGHLAILPLNSSGIPEGRVTPCDPTPADADACGAAHRRHSDNDRVVEVERGHCYVCHRPMRNPVCIRSSGVAGCYACLKDKNICPVTREAFTNDELIRLRMNLG